MICIFPCFKPELRDVGTFQLPDNVSGIIHNCSAIGFFGCLSVNSLFRFTKHGDLPLTKNKKKRNIIYIVCGVGMIASFMLFFVPDFFIKVWLIETIALFFFGISFLTKANCYKWLFCD